MDPAKLTYNLISNHTHEEVEALARKVEHLSSDYTFPREKVLHDFPELQRLDFSVTEFRYLQLSLVGGILKENLRSWFDEHSEQKVGDFISLVLDVALQLPPEFVIDRFRASGIRVLQSGRFAYLSDQLSESQLADRAVDTSLWEKEIRKFAKVTGWSS
jgi:hypothetical protein